MTSFFKTVLTRVGLPLLLISLFFELAEFILMQETQAELFNSEGASSMIWLYGGLSLIASILGPLLMMSFLFIGLKGADPFEFLPNMGPQLLKEQLRAYGKVFTWGLFLIVPAFYRLFTVMMVPWIVAFDTRYQRGELDAIRASTQFFHRHWWRILGLGLLFGLVLPVILSSWDEHRDPFSDPIGALTLGTIDLGLFLLFQWRLFRLWERENESTFVPMA